MSLPYETVITKRMVAADWALSAGLIRPETHALIAQVLAYMKSTQSPVCTLSLRQMSQLGYQRPGRPPDLPLNVHFAWIEHDPYGHRNAYAGALSQAHCAGFFVNDFNADRAEAIEEFGAHFTSIPGIRAGREWNCTTGMHFRLWSEQEHTNMLTEHIMRHHIDLMSRVTSAQIREF